MIVFNIGLWLGCWAAAIYLLLSGQPQLSLAYAGFGVGYLGLALI